MFNGIGISGDGNRFHTSFKIFHQVSGKVNLIGSISFINCSGYVVVLYWVEVQQFVQTVLLHRSCLLRS